MPYTLSVLRSVLCSVDVSVSESRTDLDSHADQCAVGRNALFVHDYERPINVSGYNPSGPVASNLRTAVSAALAYDDAMSGQTVILIVNQAIYIPDLNHNLLGTMQLCLNDVNKVNDVPRFLTDEPDEHTHSLVIPTADDPYVIPLTLKGVASSFPTRKPTEDEYETLPHLHLTHKQRTTI